jgi:anaerobic selenocysteine-containing dehydrogenase
MSEPDARPRGIRDGNRVREFNLCGNMLLKARVDGAVQASVVSAKLDRVKFTQRNRNIHVLTIEKLAYRGNSATFYSVLVEVELAKAEFVKAS